MSGEKRSGRRRRTRLQSGKLADIDGRFLADCMIHDRSTQGARLRMDDAQSMPETMLLFEDSTETLIGAALVWRSRTELGIRFTSSPVGEEMRRIEHKLSGRYYAV